MELNKMSGMMYRIPCVGCGMSGMREYIVSCIGCFVSCCRMNGAV